VFAILDTGNWVDRSPILLERVSLRGDTAPRRETGQEVAGGFEVGPSGGRFTDVSPTLDCRAKNGPIQNQLGAGVLCLAHGQGGAELGINRSPTLTCNHEAPIAAYSVALRGRNGGGTAELGGEVATCLRASGGGSDKSHVLTYAIQAGALRTNPASGPDGVGIQENIAYTLEARAEVQAIAFSCKDNGGDATVNLSPTLRSMGHAGSHQNGGGQMAVCIGLDEEQNAMIEAFGTLKARTKGGGFEGAVMTRWMAVRRLLPTECEALQGFDKNYTRVPNGKKMLADGPRYKALGNSMCVNVMRYIGERIQAAVYEVIERRAA
jgi:DNA (cytosine-5)-methyltransferase 1